MPSHPRPRREVVYVHHTRDADFEICVQPVREIGGNKVLEVVEFVDRATSCIKSQSPRIVSKCATKRGAIDIQVSGRSHDGLLEPFYGVVIRHQ